MIDLNCRASYYRTYNRVMHDTGVCPEGELLTDKELERMKQHNVKRDWPKTHRVKVHSGNIYFFFGVRFATEALDLETGETLQTEPSEPIM